MKNLFFSCHSFTNNFNDTLVEFGSLIKYIKDPNSTNVSLKLPLNRTNVPLQKLTCTSNALYTYCMTNVFKVGLYLNDVAIIKFTKLLYF